MLPFKEATFESHLRECVVSENEERVGDVALVDVFQSFCCHDCLSCVGSPNDCLLQSSLSFFTRRWGVLEVAVAKVIEQDLVEVGLVLRVRFLGRPIVFLL